MCYDGTNSTFSLLFGRGSTKLLTNIMSEYIVLSGFCANIQYTFSINRKKPMLQESRPKTRSLKTREI